MRYLKQHISLNFEKFEETFTMKSLFFSIALIVPSIEMRCPIFTRCEQEDDILPNWSPIFPKAPSIIFPQNRKKKELLKDLVDLFPKNVPSSPSELKTFLTDLKSTLTSKTSTTPLSPGEYLREGQCQYTCKKTGGCKTELVVDGANITETWYSHKQYLKKSWHHNNILVLRSAVTEANCVSSLNDGKCSGRVNGCNDCNKVYCFKKCPMSIFNIHFLPVR